jgi:gas vesicle protein
MDNGKVVLGMLAGVAAGAVLGILFAPEKGSVTRGRIAQKGADSLDDVKNKLEDLMTALTDKLEEVKEDASELFEKGKDKVEASRKELMAEMN